ncbi:MAG: aryl-sulfate sulfotransferase [Myxococcota bacterium]
MPTDWVLVAVLAGCSDGAGAPEDLTVTVSPTMPTVIHVDWTTAEPVSAQVRFAGFTTPADPSSTAHHHTLVGVGPDTEVGWEILTDGTVVEAGTIRTGSLPDRPVAVATGETTRLHLTALLGETSARIVLLDRAGSIVWDHVDTRGLSVFRARAVPDGVWYASVLVNGGPSPDSVLVHVNWDGEEDRVIAVPDLAHDFVVLPDGRLGALAYDTVDDVLGNKIVEVDPETGVAVDRWSAWDCFDPVANPSDDPTRGWTHTNALDYDPVADAYLVGMRNLHTIARVDRATGACPWAFGGTGGDVAVDGELFVHQHQFEQIDGGLLVFDNDGAPGDESRVLEYTFDPDAHTGALVETYRAEPPLYSFILGDVHRLPDGGTTIGWSVPGVFEERDRSGEVRARFDYDAGLLGFVEPLLDAYRPD